MCKINKFSFVNMSLYLSILYISTFLFILGFLGAHYEPGAISSFVIFIGSLGLIITSVYWAMTLYRLWEFIFDESSKAGLKPSVDSPKSAVWKLFIPGYNFYWIFICFRGLSHDLTILASKRGLSARLSTGFANTVCIFCILGCIPLVNFIAMPITTMILMPLYIFKITTFARNLKIHVETGKDLFVAHEATCKNMPIIRAFIDIFPKTSSKNTMAVVLIVLAVWAAYVNFFVFLSGRMGFRDALLALMILSGIHIFTSHRFKSALLIIGSWIVASGMAGVCGSFILSSYYDGTSWTLQMILWAGSFLYGLIFTGMLFLIISIAGIRWWGIFSTYIAAFILYSLVGKFIFKSPGFFMPGIFSVLLGFSFVASALYSSFYFYIRTIIENELLKDEN